MNERNEQTSALSSFISKMLRDNFGKGPEGVYVTVADKYITFYIKNFMSPTERVLMKKRQEKTLQETRDLVMDDLIPEIKTNIKYICQMEVKEFYYDWDLHNKTAIFVAVSSEETKSNVALYHEYIGKESLEQEVEHISRVVQKSPNQIESFFLNDRTLLLIRKGLLVSIEKELIRDGLRERLKVIKRQLEKKHFHSNGHFAQFLETNIHDIFLDWDFDCDKSIIAFITDPVRGVLK